MIKEWIESYNPKNREQVNQALREIMQEIALAGFFNRRKIAVKAIFILCSMLSIAGFICRKNTCFAF
jgi:hypothetical protein